KVEKTPYSVQKVGREALKLWIEPLAEYLGKEKPPRGLEQVLNGLSREQLAFMALRAVMDQIHFGWDRRRKGRQKKRVKNPDMLFRVELGQSVSDELEFAGLLAAKKYVKTARKKHAAIERLKFRRIDWTRRECARVGDWLWNCLAQMSCFDEDARGFPCFRAEHKAELDKLAEEVLYAHPLYKPKLTEPPPWTAWRAECPGDIGATFVKANDPETIETIKAAFDSAAQARLARAADSDLIEGVSIETHARAVSAIQSVPLKIN